MARTATKDQDKRGGRGRGRPPLELVQPPESGREAFMRIAAGRVNKLLDKLGTLAKLASGKSKYGYTDEDVEHIRKTLIDGVNAACDRLRRKQPKAGFSFQKPGE